MFCAIILLFILNVLTITQEKYTNLNINITKTKESSNVRLKNLKP